MNENYDYSKPIANPYAVKVSQSVTFTVGNEVVEYFQQLESQLGLPYQSIMALFLRDCAVQKRTLDIDWGTDDVDHQATLLKEQSSDIPNRPIRKIRLIRMRSRKY